MPKPSDSPALSPSSLASPALLLTLWGGGVLLAAIGLALRWTEVDLPLFLWLNAGLCRPEHGCVGVWSGLSVAGLALAVVMWVLALDRRDSRALAALIWSVPIGTVLTHLPKWLLGWPRPPVVLAHDSFHLIGRPIIGSPSMPSGHSLTAFTAATILCLAMGWGWRGRLLALLAAVAVVLSRLANGAHWPGDVLAGSGLGLITGWLALRLSADGRLAAWLQRPDRQRWIAAVELLLALALAQENTGYPAAEPVRWALVLLAVCSAAVRWQGGDTPWTTAVSRLAVAAPLLGLVVAGVQSDASWDRLRPALLAVPVWGWPLVIVGLWGSYLLRAERMRREWGGWLQRHQPATPPPTLRGCLGLFLNHNAALLLLPMRAGEAGYPWMLHRRWGVPVAQSLRSLLWLRLQDALVLALLGLALLLPLPWTARLGLTLLAGIAALWGLPWLLRQLRFPQSDRLRTVIEVLHEHASDRAGWWLCIGNWLLKLAVLGGLLAVLAGLPWWTGWQGALGGELAAAQPVQAPAGLGTYEAGIWAAVQLDGPAGAGLISAALVVHAVSLLTALLSWALYLAWAHIHARHDF